MNAQRHKLFNIRKNFIRKIVRKKMIDYGHERVMCSLDLGCDVRARAIDMSPRIFDSRWCAFFFCAMTQTKL